MSTKTISRVTLVVAILFIASFSAISQTTQKGNKTKPVEEQPLKEGPAIEFKKTVHDYGTIYQEANGECVFEFKNVGNEPVVLSNVTSSCGCTVPNWPREPIMPGKTATITVKYNTNKVGPINRSVTVKSNSVDGDVVLSIKGQVKPKQEEALPDKQQSPMQTTPN